MPPRAFPDRFAVAFSLAGEQRNIVLPIAEEVERLLGPSTVFYYEWFEHWTAGPNANLLLQKLYGDDAELVVVCVSGEYGSKPWTKTEFEAVLAFQQAASGPGSRERIFPIRVGEGDVPGLPKTTIAPDVRSRTAADAAAMVVARLELLRGSARGAGTTAAGAAQLTAGPVPAVSTWPSSEPELQWPMADHTDARAAFARLLCDGAHERALLIRGGSDTGKTHMSNQMIVNAQGLPGVAAGRFDLKGTSDDKGIELQGMVGMLGLDPPPGQTLNERLGGVLAELRRLARPALLVFDTYEQASPEATSWIEKILLPILRSAPWLRVVIIGQTVPDRRGTIWESAVAPVLTLRIPGPEEWFAYGRDHQDDLKLANVVWAYERVNGSPTILRTLLGPRA